MIAGFLAPSAGAILVDGRPIADIPPHRRSVGMVFQRLALFPHMTAAENVAYPLRMRGFRRGDIAGRVARYLDLVQLGGLGQRRIHQLSGGQQQRVAIARALVFEPDLLLLDEPLASLDKKLREDMQIEFRRIQQELGVTTINVTHDQREALVMSDKVVVMRDGRLLQSTSPEETYRNPADPFVAGFIGVTNFLPGRLVEAQADGFGIVAVGEARLRGRGGRLAEAQVEAALRAEHVRVVEGPDDAGAVTAGTVTDAIFEGDRIVYVVRCEGLGDVDLRAFEHDPFRRRPFVPGTRVGLAWQPEDMMIFPASHSQIH